MIFAYPLLLVTAAVVGWRGRDSTGGRGSAWFAAWTAAGVLFAFSFVTGFSIGLLVLPAAAVLLLWLATAAPHAREASGFLLGSASIALVVVVLNT